MKIIRYTFFLENIDGQLEEGSQNEVVFTYKRMGSTYYSLDGGSVNILKIDRVNNFVAGTFSGFIDDPTEIEITNGRFIIDYFY